eukprot:7853538-Lingulodinium_polyedra.AAC.1
MSDNAPLLGTAALRLGSEPDEPCAKRLSVAAASPGQSPRPASGARSDTGWAWVGASATRSIAGSTTQ